MPSVFNNSTQGMSILCTTANMYEVEGVELRDKGEEKVVNKGIKMYYVDVQLPTNNANVMD